MSRKVELDIEILKNGKVKFHVKGRKGPSCLEFLDLMQKKLGKVDKKEFTAEYYEQEETERVIEIDSENT